MSCRGIVLRSRHGTGTEEAGAIPAIVGDGTNATGGASGKAMGVTLSIPVLLWGSVETAAKGGGSLFLGIAGKDAICVARDSEGGF